MTVHKSETRVALHIFSSYMYIYTYALAFLFFPSPFGHSYTGVYIFSGSREQV